MKTRTCIVLVLAIAVFLGAGRGQSAAATRAPEKAASPTPYDCSSATGILPADCQALAALYNATNGPSWTNHTDWLVTGTPCSWFGVTCNADRVIELALSTNNLSGPIPVELGNLTSLQGLDLDLNQLTGSIPTQLGSLADLQNLDLSDNLLSGSIPTQLGSLANLQVLQLSWNSLNGSIPSQLGSLTALQSLQLSNNQLSGSIPSQLGGLNSLQVLNLFNNQLSGSIPTQLGSLPQLDLLQLGLNQLTGTIPTELGSLANLEQLDLGDNHLSGSIPAQMGGLAMLTYLYLSDNQLTGAIPSQLGSLTSLTTLALADNALAGEVPATFTNLASLDPSFTDLGFNMLTASSPAVVAFLNSKDPNWAQTQTVPPANGQAAAKSATSAELTWTPIPYTGDGGYYEIGYSTTPGGPYSISGQTPNKSASSYLAGSLLPSTTYYFVVRTYTPAHGAQQNNLTSGWSSVILYSQIRLLLPLIAR